MLPAAPVACKLIEPVAPVEIVGVNPAAFKMLPFVAVRFTAPAAAVADTLVCRLIPPVPVSVNVYKVEPLFAKLVPNTF